MSAKMGIFGKAVPCQPKWEYLGKLYHVSQNGNIWESCTMSAKIKHPTKISEEIV
jgi:hypothetical protein